MIKTSTQPHSSSAFDYHFDSAPTGGDGGFCIAMDGDDKRVERFALPLLSSFRSLSLAKMPKCDDPTFENPPSRHSSGVHLASFSDRTRSRAVSEGAASGARGVTKEGVAAASEGYLQ